MNTTSTRPTVKPITCKKCQANHFSHQLACKRCGHYFDNDHVMVGSNSHSLAIAAGITTVAVAVLALCAILHAF